MGTLLQSIYITPPVGPHTILRLCATTWVEECTSAACAVLCCAALCCIGSERCAAQHAVQTPSHAIQTPSHCTIHAIMPQTDMVILLCARVLHLHIAAASSMLLSPGGLSEQVPDHVSK